MINWIAQVVVLSGSNATMRDVKIALMDRYFWMNKESLALQVDSDSVT